MSADQGNEVLRVAIEAMAQQKDPSAFIKGIYRGQLMTVAVYMQHDADLMAEAMAAWEALNARPN